MIILDCETRASTLASVSAIYDIPADAIHDFLRSYDPDARTSSPWPPREAHVVLRDDFETEFGRAAKPFDRVCWFHATRVRNPEGLYRGIEPLPVMLPRIWSMLFDIFQGTPHLPRLESLRAAGVSRAYQHKVAGTSEDGPSGWLVRDVILDPESIGQGNYLRVPEIVHDICMGYEVTFGESISEPVSQALAPCIVKFWSTKQIGSALLTVAMYYLHTTARGPLTAGAVATFDGENSRVPAEQVVDVEQVEPPLSEK